MTFSRLAPLRSVIAAPVRDLADLMLPNGIAARSPADLDVDWLAAMLGLPAGAVTGCEVTDLDHGTSMRVRLRIHHGGTSTSVFVKHTPTRVAARTFNLAAKLCENEVRFYRDVADRSGCAPTALAARWHPITGRSTLVLPDLTDDGFDFLEVAESISADRAALVIEALARLHRAFWGRSPADEYLPAKSFSRIGTPLLCRHLGGAPRAVAAHLPSSFVDDLHLLRTHAGQLDGLFTSFDQTLLHNDSHQGNVAYRTDTALLLDWQVSSMGSALKDVAYFMACIDTDVRRACERDLLDLYLAALSAGDGPVIGWDDAWTQYRILVITGFIASAATALFGDRLQNAQNAVVGLQRSATTLVDMESFRAVEDALGRQ